MSEEQVRGQHKRQQREQERERAPYLSVVGRQGDEATGSRLADLEAYSAAVRAAAEDGERSGRAAAGSSSADPSGLANALMSACVSWVALVREETAQSVDLTPIGQLSYEADVLLADSGERVLLPVELKVEPGLVVRTVVEPARPS